jgi:putative heme-binding domain-containing protein
VTYVGPDSTAPSRPAQPLQANRDTRHRLEAFHGRRDPQAVDAAWPYLAEQDRALRYAARIALEWQDPATWRQRALTEQNPRAAIAALVGLIRASGRDEIHRAASDPTPGPEPLDQVLTALNKISWETLEYADQLDLLRAYSLAFIRLGSPSETQRERVITALEPRFPSRRPEVDALLARLLIYLEAPSAAATVMTALESAPTQEEQVDLAVALRSLRTGWTPELRERYFRWYLAAERFRGGNTFASSLRTAKNEAVELLSAADRQALQGVLEARVDVPSPRAALDARPFVKQWQLNELVPLVETGLRGGRDFDRGRQLYSAVACAACHRFVDEGGSVGPELTGVVGRYNVRDMLEAIVDPNKVISDQYQAIIVETKSGQTITGRVSNLSGENLNIVEDMLEPGRMTNVRRADIESIQPATVSMMPQGLLNSLTAEEIQDLVGYLMSRGDAHHAMFREQ